MTDETASRDIRAVRIIPASTRSAPVCAGRAATTTSATHWRWPPASASTSPRLRRRPRPRSGPRGGAGLPRRQPRRHRADPRHRDLLRFRRDVPPRVVAPLPADRRGNWWGDFLSGIAALILTVALAAFGDVLLAVASGLLLAAGKFGSALAPEGYAAPGANPWPNRFRTAVLASRLPALAALGSSSRTCRLRRAGARREPGHDDGDARLLPPLGARRHAAVRGFLRDSTQATRASTNASKVYNPLANRKRTMAQGTQWFLLATQWFLLGT